MNRQDVKIFGIDSIDDYLAFCDGVVAELNNDQSNVHRAFTAILALNHIIDWLHHKITVEQSKAIGLTNSQDFKIVKDHFENKNADISLVRQIANGFKHLRLRRDTQKIAGYGQGPFGVGPFDSPYLLIDLGDDKPTSERWVVGFELCNRVLTWWRAELSGISNVPGGNQNV